MKRFLPKDDQTTKHFHQLKGERFGPGKIAPTEALRGQRLLAALAGPEGEVLLSGLGRKTKSRRPLMSKCFQLKRLSPTKRFGD